jgi:F0F1-type ATP synthase gamma subunit
MLELAYNYNSQFKSSYADKIKKKEDQATITHIGSKPINRLNSRYQYRLKREYTFFFSKILLDHRREILLEHYAENYYNSL